MVRDHLEEAIKIILSENDAELRAKVHYIIAGQVPFTVTLYLLKQDTPFVRPPAMIALDNRLLALRYQGTDCPLKPLPKLLFLRRYTSYSMPPLSSLTHHLLERQCLINWIPHKRANARDSIPLSQEEILCLDPDCLFLSSTTPEATTHFVKNDPALTSLSAVKNGRVYTVDAHIQDEPSQFFILAYYDICLRIAEDLSCRF